MTSDAAPPPGEPSPEELMQAIVERLSSTPVRDILLQSMATFVDCAGIRLGLGPKGDDVKDLAMARQAIEALRALIAVAEHELGQAQVRQFKEPLAQLQLAYAQMSEAERPSPAPGAGEEAPVEGDAGPTSDAGARRPPPPGREPDPASRLWVPPGARRPGT